MTRFLTIIESPFAKSERATQIEHEAYLRRCLRDSWGRGEVPFASHAFFPYFLDEGTSKERAAGIAMGLQFWAAAEKIVFYRDMGMSPGMEKAKETAKVLGIAIEERWILEHAD